MEASGEKWLVVSRLSELLSRLAPDSRIMVNTVGNLLVKSPDGERSVAYIDFLFEGEIESMEESA